MENEEVKKEEVKRVAIYMRVSTDEQAKEGFSLDEQLNRLKMFVNSREDWKLVKEYVDDGYTGRNINRPAYKEMIADLSKWDMVVIKKLDRIHRSSKNFNDMISFLKEHHKEFVSQNESWDTSTAMGRFVMDIMVRVAQLESEQTGERVYDALVYKAKTNNGWMGRLPAHGYIYNPKTKKVTMEHEELQKVKRAFELYAADGFSIRSLAKEVGLTFGKMKRILHTPTYTGYELWDRFLRPITADPIISIELFDRVQIKLANKFRGSPKKSKNKHKPFILGKYVKEFNPDHEVIELNEKDIRLMGYFFKSRHNYKF